jgi:antitoxin (DNA-binding transcriptional repressor) of toxin-antitoxin stability system
MTSIFRSEQMKSLGIRQAKAHLSELVRDAAQGECSLVTDNRKPVAMIGPPPQDPVEAEAPSLPLTEETKPPSDAAQFRKALFGVPFPIDFPFGRYERKNHGHLVDGHTALEIARAAEGQAFI